MPGSATAASSSAIRIQLERLGNLAPIDEAELRRAVVFEAVDRVGVRRIFRLAVLNRDDAVGKRAPERGARDRDAIAVARLLDRECA